MPKPRTQTMRENAGEDMKLVAPRPPEAICKGRIQCGHCSTTHEPDNKMDTHPQCPWCGNLIDLTAEQRKTA